MISRIHNKLGTAGLVVAIVALVVALTGAAFAAVPGLNSKQKKEATKIAKKYAGKDGAAGPQGLAGPAGPAGKDGTNGTDGTDGEDGDDGTDGKSVVVGTAGAECPAGGATVQVTGEPSTKKAVCNGEDGEDGETGFTDTLPPGATETGYWALGNDDGASIVPLSFNIPLSEAPTAFHYVAADGKEVISGEEGIEHVEAVNCHGSAEEPTAPEGEVCVYALEEANPGAEEESQQNKLFPGYIPSSFFEKLLPSGASFFVSLIGPGQRVQGTWAVTGN